MFPFSDPGVRRSPAAGWRCGLLPRIVALRTALVGLGVAVAIPAFAGRPLATDDAAVVEDGACQLESWVERARDSRSAWVNAGCNPLGGTEFSLGGARGREDGASAFTVQQWQIKHLLRSPEGTQPGFALAVGGQRLRHERSGQTFLKGIATVPLAGHAHLLHLNLGASHARGDDGHRARAVWALAYDTQVASGTRAAVETFGTAGERANWQVGLRHELVPGRVQIDASVGSTLGRWSSTRVFTVGLVFVSPAFLR